MIYTLTMNPAIDMNFSCSSIASSIVNRCCNNKYIPNGKGVNVSYVLKHYGIESSVLGFFGNFTGKYIVEQLINSGINIQPVWVNDITRINVFINCDNNEYKFVNKGPCISSNKQKEFLELFKDINNCEYIVISGSLPDGIKDEYYKEILEICGDKSIKVILDISSSILKELLKYKPILIKPNDEEIENIFNIKIKNEEDIKNTLIFLYEKGAQNILLTLGDRGMYFYNGKNMFYCSAVKVKVFSSACAGDSCLAAFLSEWINGGDIICALKKASATGANVAETEGLGLLENVDKYIDKVNVRKVDC